MVGIAGVWRRWPVWEKFAPVDVILLDLMLPGRSLASIFPADSRAERFR